MNQNNQSMEEILHHPWLNDRAPTHKLTHDYCTRIKRLVLRKRLKRVFEARMENIMVMDSAAAEVIHISFYLVSLLPRLYMYIYILFCTT